MSRVFVSCRRTLRHTQRKSVFCPTLVLPTRPPNSETNIYFAALCHEWLLVSKQKEYSALSRIYRLPVLENLASDVDAALSPND
jgi:hypothetical protein